MAELNNTRINREKTFEFLSDAIVNLNNFIANPSPSASSSLIDEVETLKNLLTFIQPILGSEITTATFNDLKASATNIKKVTDDIDNAINSILGADKALNELSNFVRFSGDLFTAIQSGGIGEVANIFLDFVASLS